MGERLAIEQRMAEAETRWPGLQFKRKLSSEASSACPFCHQATVDGFLIFDTGSYWCRKCNTKGFIDENDPHPPSPEKLLEIRLAALEQKQREHDKRLSALERMARSRDHLLYHEHVNEGLRDMWYEKGVGDHLIDQYRLGVCWHCKTDQPGERMSMTIPVTVKGQLVNIRHRLIGGDQRDKYRPHMAGLGNTLFGADDVYSDDTSSILIIEGEIKRIVVKDRIGGNIVGTMGKAGFQKAWASRFSRFDEVLICLDPDAIDKAREVSSWFGGRARVVDLPVKPDDFFVLHKGTPDQFREFVRMARRVA
jgi:hypothetical protein